MTRNLKEVFPDFPMEQLDPTGGFRVCHPEVSYKTKKIPAASAGTMNRSQVSPTLGIVCSQREPSYTWSSHFPQGSLHLGT